MAFFEVWLKRLISIGVDMRLKNAIVKHTYLYLYVAVWDP